MLVPSGAAVVLGDDDDAPPSEDAAWRDVRLPTLPPSGAERIIDRLAVLQAATIKGDAPPPLPEEKNESVLARRATA